VQPKKKKKEEEENVKNYNEVYFLPVRRSLSQLGIQGIEDFMTGRDQ
jgi:hypothetical protein